VIVYVVNIVFLGVMNYLVWRHITNPKLQLTDGLGGEERAYFSFRAVTVPVVFIATALVYLLVEPRIAIYIPLLIPIVMRILRWRYRKFVMRKGG
jgi:hypothetical protein